MSEEGATCDGEPAILQVARFAPGADVASEVISEDLDQFRFTADQEGVVIALAPVGFDIPPPPQSSIDVAAAASPNVLNTDGLANLPSASTEGEGFNADGNLIDTDGNEILDDDGNTINFRDLIEETEDDSDG